MKFRPGGISLDYLFRKIMPRGLFGRSLLTVLIPLILLQVVALDIFYGSHLHELSRRLAEAVAGEVAFEVDAIDREPQTRRLVFEEAEKHFDFQSRFFSNQVLRHLPPPDAPGPVDQDLAFSLADNLRRPFNVDWYTAPAYIRVNVQMVDGVISIEVPRKHLYVGTLYLFLVWLLGTAVILFGISALFLRGQVRGIRRLAVAAEAFGMGRDPGPIKPEGAIEVRRAATAFNRMQERLRRFVAQRTTMLAGVSHDLRTPLTRLRLTLAMLPETPAGDLAEMTSDVEEMEKLIGIYLAFARGEGNEGAQPTDFSLLLDEIANAARRSGASITCTAPDGLFVTLRPEAMRRAITNLIDNARQHARHIAVSVRQATERTIHITIDDDGPGIPAEKREMLFRPFESSSPGGTGLGLAIARDIVGAHGGNLVLADSPMGGLRAIIEIPA
jgi:two-component system osmolarity sensor histidine kinase EnvZ